MASRLSRRCLYVAFGAVALIFAACGDGGETNGAPCTGNCGADTGAPFVGSDAGVATLGGTSTPGAPAGGGSSSLDGGAAAGPTAGGGGTPGPTAGSGQALPCAVQSILAEKCQLCHGDPPSFGAYMALTNYAQFHAQGTTDKTKTYAELAKLRINAEVSGAGHMPPPTSPQLSAEELLSLNAWLDQGAPAAVAGQSCGGPTTGGDGGMAMADAGDNVSDLDCYKFLARGSDMKSPFKVGSATDAYYDVVFAAPWKDTAYGVVIRPVIDNKQIIHHWLLFQDNKPGTPSGAKHGSGAHPNAQLLHGWAPGADPIDFRETGVDVGLELPQTTYTVEFHYNSSDPNAVDASGVEVCVAKSKPANIAALSWLGHDNTFLAGDLGGPAETWTGTCKPKATEPVHILMVWPHMHLQGRRMKATIARKNGSTEVLHDEAFDFDYQRAYKKNVMLMPGESITTTCSFAKPMSFGEGTSDEMCYLFTMAYPKGALVDDGAWGKTAHGGSACLGQ